MRLKDGYGQRYKIPSPGIDPIGPVEFLRIIDSNKLCLARVGRYKKKIN
jgi:hypothetical protein